MYAVWAIAIGIVSTRGIALDSLPIALQEIMVPLRFASMTRSRMTRLTKTNLVIQALKSLSDEQITDDVVKKVSNLERDPRSGKTMRHLGCHPGPCAGIGCLSPKAGPGINPG